MSSDTQSKVQARHLKRSAFLYVRRSSLRQVFENSQSSSVNLETGRSFIQFERGNRAFIAAKQAVDGGSRLVAAAHPDDLGRRRQHAAISAKLSRERNEHEVVSFGVLPHLAIASGGQFNQSHVVGVGKHVSQGTAGPGAEILVKQQFHFAAVTRRRSRSAA
jgi:hypothetical protein